VATTSGFDREDTGSRSTSLLSEQPVTFLASPIGLRLWYGFFEWRSAERTTAILERQKLVEELI